MKLGIDFIKVQTYKKYIKHIKPGTLMIIDKFGKVKPYNWREINDRQR